MHSSLATSGCLARDVVRCLEVMSVGLILYGKLRIWDGVVASSARRRRPRRYVEIDLGSF